MSHDANDLWPVDPAHSLGVVTRAHVNIGSALKSKSLFFGTWLDRDLELDLSLTIWILQAEWGWGGAAWAGQVSAAERGESGESRHCVRGDESEVHDHCQLQGISRRHEEHPGKKY